MLIIQRNDESVDHFSFERKKTKAKLKDNQQIVMVFKRLKKQPYKVFKK